jgi:type II secretory pathway component PulF
MPVFRYVAKTKEGREFRGSLEAPTQEVAQRELHAQGVHLIDMVQVGPTFSESSQRQRSAAERSIFDPILFRISQKKLAWFFHQLSATTNAGLSLGESLEIISRNLQPVRFRAAVTDLREAVMRGNMLSEEMKRFPTIFPELVISLVQAGEKTGNLPELFASIAEWYDYEVSIRTKLFTATLYPKIVLMVAVAASFIVANASLATTKPLLLAASCPVTIAAAIGAWVVYKGAGRWLEQFSKWRRGWDEFKLAIPVIGGMFRRFATASFCRTMAILYRSGILLHTALESAADACGNLGMAARLRTAIPEVMAGGSLSEALRKTGQLSDTVIHMVATGEKTGDLDTLLQKTAQYASDEADATAQRMIPIAFVLFFLVAAVIVLFILIRFYMGYATGLLNGAD